MITRLDDLKKFLTSVSYKREAQVTGDYWEGQQGEKDRRLTIEFKGNNAHGYVYMVADSVALSQRINFNVGNSEGPGYPGELKFTPVKIDEEIDPYVGDELVKLGLGYIKEKYAVLYGFIMNCKLVKDNQNCPTAYITYNEVLDVYEIHYNTDFVLKKAFEVACFDFTGKEDALQTMVRFAAFVFLHEVSHALKYHLIQQQSSVSGLSHEVINIVGDSAINISLSKKLDLPIMPGLVDETVTYTGVAKRAMTCKDIKKEIEAWGSQFTAKAIAYGYFDGTWKAGDDLSIVVTCGRKVLERLFADNSNRYIVSTASLVNTFLSVDDAQSGDDSAKNGDGTMSGGMSGSSGSGRSQSGGSSSGGQSGSGQGGSSSGSAGSSSGGSSRSTGSRRSSGSQYSGSQQSSSQSGGTVGNKQGNQDNSDGGSTKSDKGNSSTGKNTGGTVDGKTDSGNAGKSKDGSESKDGSLDKGKEKKDSTLGSKAATDALQKAIEDAIDKNQDKAGGNEESATGSTDGSSESDILKSLGADKIARNMKNLASWKMKLHKYLQDALATTEKYESEMPNARIEGQFGREVDIQQPKRIILAIDCSGSMGPQTFIKCLKEIQTFLVALPFKHIEVDVIYWGTSTKDIRIRQINNSLVTKIKDGYVGCGGTEFELPVRLIKKKYKKFDLCIVFTDGEFGTDSNSKDAIAFSHRYKQRFLWVMTPKYDLDGPKKFDPTVRRKLIVMH